jgi:hypothetical protein
MNKTLVKLLKGALLMGAVSAALAATPAQAQIEVRVGPPAWYIATTRPTYYEGHASYWYGNRWHYREGNRWRAYREEPRYLRDRRGGDRGSERHDYGRDNRGGYGRDNQRGPERR